MIENGILNINKPQGMTSHDVVYRVRRALGIKRVGHTGTLDPMCTGVLPICIGTATRVTEYLDLDFKTYRCTLLLGKQTDTQDIWGEVLEEKPTVSAISSQVFPSLRRIIARSTRLVLTYFVRGIPNFSLNALLKYDGL